MNIPERGPDGSVIVPARNAEKHSWGFTYEATGDLDAPPRILVIPLAIFMVVCMAGMIASFVMAILSITAACP